MNLRLLEYFLVTAEAESINKAAETIPISQPTLSRQLRELENEVGVELFLRDNKGITLTEEGVLLKRRAREILDLMDKTEHELKEQTEVIEGKLTIGCGESKAVENFVPLMKEFRKLYPLVTFELFTGSADDVTEGMDKGLIDIGILIEPVNLDKFDYIRLSDKQYYVATMAADDPLADKDFITKEDLIGRELILPKRHSVQDELGEWFGEDFDRLNIAYTGNLLLNSLILVKDGNDIAITVERPEIMCGNNDVVSVLLKPEISVKSVIAWKHANPYPKLLDKFIDFLVENIPDGDLHEKKG
ncbi:MAG: LysR family transcriptional regulator [Catonella sp.]|jgi:DNA-binding transcriptional LysR family regulator|nr:LysR family transcriptional regulator [Catonella sp.]MDY6356059.1 LysR family transcriptional regulator [Catonella sp.]